MAKVPFQNYKLGEQVETGSEVQFGATSVEPQKDVVSDDIKRMSQAQIAFGKTLNRIDDQLNDSEAKRLYNEAHYEVEAVVNEYGQLQGYDAVKPLTTEGEGEDQVYTLDEYNNNKLKKVLDTGSDKASNGVVKYMYEQMMSSSIKSAQNKMINHSLTQGRIALENETDASIDIHKTKAKNNYKDFRDPEGEFNKNRIAAHRLLEQKAVLKGWNLDPNAVDANGKKIGISEQYLKEKSELDKEIAKDVLDKLDEDKDTEGIKDFLASLKPFTSDKTFNELAADKEQKHENFKGENCVNATLANTGNQNDGEFLSQINKTMCLKSNHAYEDGNGGVVTDGLHSNENETSGTTTTENIETLQKIRDTSKFYSPESSQAGTLIPEHQTTHLFAIQHIGVEKADSLYTKAKSDIEIDKAKYKEDPVYAEKINKKIIQRYNQLIVQEAAKKYKFGGGEYVSIIENDLAIIEKGIDYNYKNTNEEVKVDFVTGLRPIEDLKREIKETITDKETQKHAIKDLEVKYEKIANQKTQIYNENLNAAKKIAFAEPNGYKNLAANGIQIDSFSPKDQEILKNGQPVDSDQGTIAKLKDNPEEVVNNLESYSHKISKSDYLELERYAKELQGGGESKIFEVKTDSKMFKSVLYKNGFGNLAFPDEELKGDDAAIYNELEDAWRDRINYAQRVEKRKLTRAEKEQLLVNVLLDKVNVGKKYKKQVTFATVLETGEKDKLDKTSVLVKVKRADGTETEDRIFNSEIPPDINIAIMAALYKRKKPMNQQQIAQLWQNMGRPETLEEADKFIKASKNYELLTMEE
tara:strand:+ start:855 stop:3281 length:2427 start_codon:yes stop_codon:yes gene_type:complete